MSTFEPQYNVLLTLRDEIGLTSLGLMTNQVWEDDPRRLAFLLARYKFVGRMLADRRRVLEVGCGDGFGARIVQQAGPDLTLLDADPLFIADIEKRQSRKWPVKTMQHDVTGGPIPGSFDGIYSLDVIEHIAEAEEEKFMANLVAPLTADGVVVIGSPSLQSQAYASPASKAGHVNCKDEPGMRRLMQKFFTNVFIFSMNDEVVHTGFYPMAHYLFALCCGPRKTAR